MALGQKNAVDEEDARGRRRRRRALACGGDHRMANTLGPNRGMGRLGAIVFRGRRFDGCDSHWRIASAIARHRTEGGWRGLGGRVDRGLTAARVGRGSRRRCSHVRARHPTIAETARTRRRRSEYQTRQQQGNDRKRSEGFASSHTYALTVPQVFSFRQPTRSALTSSRGRVQMPRNSGEDRPRWKPTNPS